MSFWSIMNVVAWGLSAYLFSVMALDFIRVEKAARAQNRKGEAEVNLHEPSR